MMHAFGQLSEYKMGPEYDVAGNVCRNVLKYTLKESSTNYCVSFLFQNHDGQ